MEGWIKLHRKTLESSLFQNPIYTHVWAWCLLKASYEITKFPFNGQDIELKPGQFLTGRGQASIELHISQQSYRTVIYYLKSTNRITTESTNKFTIISIVKWEEYQGEINQQTNQQTNQPATSQQPATNHIQEAKKLKKSKEIYTDDFLNFWNQSHKKGSKWECFKFWQRLNETERGLAVETIPKHMVHWKTTHTDPKYIPDTRTWISHKRWEEEFIQPRKKTIQEMAQEALNN